MPVLGLGTFRFGERPEERESDIRATRSAIDAGISHLDTAELYGDGTTESFLREAIAPYDRKQLFIASKASTGHARPEDVIAACHGSLDRMGLDYLDLYMPHNRNLDVPLNETMSAFDQLISEGLIRNLGLSNFGSASLDAARCAAGHPIVVNQVHYNLAVRAPETDGLLANCQTSDVLPNAWRPVMRSYLGGGTIVDDNARSAVVTMADKYKKSPIQISLNWLLSQHNVIALVKTSNDVHFRENLGALGWSLSNEDIELLRISFPSQRVHGDVPLL